MIIKVNLGYTEYDITVERGALNKAGELLNLNRRVLVVTDSGVPTEYAECVAAQCREAFVVTVPQGEESKSLGVYEQLLSKMLSENFTRKDCVVAVGGGVVGDLAGFVASSFMRGVDFYNIPTTVLSQVDSSIGGKVAVNLDGIKNIVGAFYQPKAVIVDPDTLSTLPKRQISAGLAEAVKMALTFDRELFEKIEKEDNPFDIIDEIIARSLKIKRDVVEKDEKEAGLRKVLNFGHTLGHAIESVSGCKELYHGECVALGMLFMCSDDVRKRLETVLEKLDLPLTFEADREEIKKALSHDKKAEDEKISVIVSEEAGTYKIIKESADELAERMKEFYI